MELGFYESQLIVLATVCAISFGLERHVAKNARQHPHPKETADERLENGKLGVGGSALSTLTRKYLLVYAVVMGMFSFRRLPVKG